ncbi:MAG: discoidin domain-containing protein, partial [Candidatus Peregrinibacteria bacterium]|nr:discoidin domain-containing protein [Candidatus Peregrinibacteria bacterium]
VNVTASDTNEANITFELYDDAGLVDSTTYTDSSRTINWTELLDNIYWYNVTMIDYSGNVNFTATRKFTVDTTNPAIDYGLNTPVDTANLSQDYIYVNVSAYDLNEANITFSLYSSVGFVGATTYTDSTRFINWTSLSDDTYYYNVTIIDDASNDNSTITREITLDTTNPAIDYGLNTAVDTANLSQNYIYVNVSAYDLNEANITFSLYDSLGLVDSITYTNGSRTINWTELLDNVYWYNVTIVDDASNKNVTFTREITLDTIAPVISYGLNTAVDAANLSQDYIYVNMSVVESNEANITFVLYNSTGLMNSTTYFDSSRTINWTGLPNGNYWYNVTIFDDAASSDSTLTREASLDTVYPLIDYTTGMEESGRILNRDWIYVNASVTEINTANVSFDLYNSTGLVNSTVKSFSTGVFTKIPIGMNLLNNSYGTFEGITATSSYSADTQAENLADKHISGNSGESWLSATGQSVNQNITINLTDNYVFDMVDVFSGYTSADSAAPKNTNVYVSDDAISWVKIASKELFGQVPSDYDYDYISFAEQNKRYVRIEFLDNWGSSYISSHEIKLYKSSSNLANSSLTTISATSTSVGSVENLRDEVFSTLWSSVSNANENITWNFSSNKDVSSLEFTGDTAAVNNFPASYSILTSDDGSSWSEISTGTFVGGLEGHYETINFTKQTTQYLRLWMKTSYGNPISSEEIRVWET